MRTRIPNDSRPDRACPSRASAFALTGSLPMNWPPSGLSRWSRASALPSEHGNQPFPKLSHFLIDKWDKLSQYSWDNLSHARSQHMNPKPRDVTGAELSVLQALWDRGPSNIRQLTEVVYPAITRSRSRAEVETSPGRWQRPSLAPASTACSHQPASRSPCRIVHPTESGRGGPMS